MNPAHETTNRRSMVRAPRLVMRRRDDRWRADDGQTDSPLTASLAQATASGGAPLGNDVRQVMEPRLGHDFSNVRVHTDDAAADSARVFSAQAYTTGSDIVFGAGKYAPGTAEGDHLLAHELTHVVQQSAGTAADIVHRAPEDGQPGATAAPAAATAPLQAAAASPDTVDPAQLSDFKSRFNWGLAMYRNWRRLETKTGHDVEAQQEMNAAAVAFGKDAVESERLQAGALIRKSMSEEEIADISEADSISGGNVMASLRELLGLTFKEPGHRYVMTLSVNKDGSVFDDVMAAAGTRVTITYTNAIGPRFAFTRDYVVTGLAIGAGLSFVMTPRRMIQDSITDGPSLGQSAKQWALDWMRSLTDPKHAATHEGGKPVDIGLDVDILNLQLTAEGIVADPVIEWWSPTDIEGVVLVPRLGRAEASAGPFSVRGVLMDAVVFTGGEQMAGDLAFPNVTPSVTPKANVVQGVGGTTMGLILDLKLVELGGAYGKLVG